MREFGEIWTFRYYFARLYDLYGNESYRVFTLQKDYGTVCLTKTALIIYDGVDLFLNVKKLRISKGFIHILNPKPFTCFNGHPQKDKLNAIDVSTAILTGAVGSAMSRGAQEDNKRSVSYVFCFETGKVHPLTAACVSRYLEPYPELNELYTIDPKRAELATMKFYIELINELIVID